MSEWIDVPVAEVAVGDEVKVDGYTREIGTDKAVDFMPVRWLSVEDKTASHISALVDGLSYRARRSSIVSVRRRKPEPRIPEPTHAWEVMCKMGVQAKDTSEMWLCSLFAGHTGSHQAWEHHCIGGRKLAESEPQPKPKPLTCHDGGTYKTADGSDACLACSLILNKRSDVHTPKEPVREPGCCAAHPEGGFGCTDHEDGFHVAKDMYGTVVSRWPIVPTEPSPKPGDWRCYSDEGSLTCPCPTEKHNERCCVYRASGGWSRDTRTGQPWVMQIGDPVEVVIKAVAGNLASAFAGLPKAIAMAGYESLEDTYKRERLDVRPVDRRGKR